EGVGVERAGAVGGGGGGRGARDVGGVGQGAGEERDARDQRKRAPQPPPGGKAAETIREPDEGGDQEKNRRSGGGRGGDERPGEDPPADAGANLGVQGEVTKPAAHSFNSCTPEAARPVDGWAKSIGATSRRAGIRCQAPWRAWCKAASRATRRWRPPPCRAPPARHRWLLAPWRRHPTPHPRRSPSRGSRPRCPWPRKYRGSAWRAGSHRPAALADPPGYHRSRPRRLCHSPAPLPCRLPPSPAPSPDPYL